jgi:hypothetical protein
VVRKAIKISESECGTTAIYVDIINAEDILAFLKKDERHRKKFSFIQEIIFGRYRLPDVYDKEEINQRCKGVTAMKFFKGQENARIYCKEVTTEDKIFVVITSELLERKKSTKLTKKDRQLIEKVASYEYIFEE